MNSPLSIPFLAHFFFQSEYYTVVAKSMYFDTRMWPFHYTYLQPSYGKLLSQRFDIFFIIIDERKHGGILKMLTTFLAVVIGFAKHSIQVYPTTDHLACALEESFSSHTSPNVFQSANANSTYFYSKRPYFELFIQRLTSWTQQHGLPPFTDEEVNSFFDEQWSLHIQELTTTPRFTFQSIKHLQQWLPSEAILHHGDHEQAKLTVFCPHLYFQGAWNTWNDPDLFRRLPLTYDEAQKTIERSIPLRIQTKYKWAINTKSDLPYGFVFLKKEETIQERPYLDFLLSKPIWKITSGYSSHH